ncbi:MAG: FHA domain-containing protein [Magnetococcales bacterium]|nr:FHA domain-containing protein [Magnetococcales bacterium]
MASIILKFRDVAHRPLPLQPSQIIRIGRKSDNDVVIDHEGISRFHARILHSDSHYIVEDMNSRNGVFLNSRRNRVQKHLLRHGDHILIGKHAIEFLLDPDEQARQIPDHLLEAKGITDLMEAKGITVGEAFKHPPMPPDPANEVMNRKTLHAGNTGKKRRKRSILRLIKGRLDGRIFRLDGIKTRIGSSDEAEIRLQGLLMPQRMAIIKKGRKGFKLFSMETGWRHKVYLNGEEVESSALIKEDDELQFGSGYLFRFETLLNEE